MRSAVANRIGRAMPSSLTCCAAFVIFVVVGFCKDYALRILLGSCYDGTNEFIVEVEALFEVLHSVPSW